MTRSIFDPTGGETERSGSQNLGPDADQVSQIPVGVITGKTSEEDEDMITDVPPPSDVEGAHKSKQ